MKQRTLITGLAFGESPRWHDGRLWVADWGARQILAIDLQGKSEVIVQLASSAFQPICFDWLPDGRLLVVSSRDGLLLKKQENRALATYADLTQVERGFNEIVADGRGNAYVNGGGFDLMAGEKFAPGIIALVKDDGASASAKVVRCCRRSNRSLGASPACSAALTAKRCSWSFENGGALPVRLTPREPVRC